MARHAMDDLFGTPQIDFDHHHPSSTHFGEERLDDIMPLSAVRRTSSAEDRFGRSEVTTPVKYDEKTLDEMLKHDQADLDDAVEHLFSPSAKKYSSSRQSYHQRTKEEVTHRDLLADVDERERQTFSPIDGASFSHSPPRPAVNHRPQLQRPQRESSQGRMSLKEQENIIDELRKDNFSLKLRIYFLEEQLDPSDRGDEVRDRLDIKVENAQLRASLQELQQAQDSTAQQSDALLVQQTESLHAELAKYKELLTSATQAIHALKTEKAEMAGAGQRVQEVTEQLKRTEERLQKAQEEAITFRKEVDSLQAEVQTLEQQPKADPSAMEEMKEDLAAAEARIREQADKLVAREKEETAVKGRAAALEEENAAQRADIERLRSEVETVTESLEAAQDQKQSLSSTLQAQHKEKVRYLEEQLSILHQQLKTLEETNTSLRHDVAAASSDDNAKDDQLQKLRREMDQLQRDRDNYQRRLRESEGMLRTQDETIETLKEKLSATTTSLEQQRSSSEEALHHQLQQAQQQHAQVDADRQSLKDQITQLKRELDKAREANASLNKALGETDHLHDAFADVEQRLKEAQRQLGDKQAELLTLREEAQRRERDTVSSQSEKVDRLHRDLLTARSQSQRAQQELEQTAALLEEAKEASHHAREALHTSEQRTKQLQQKLHEREVELQSLRAEKEETQFGAAALETGVKRQLTQVQSQYRTALTEVETMKETVEHTESRLKEVQRQLRDKQQQLQEVREEREQRFHTFSTEQSEQSESMKREMHQLSAQNKEHLRTISRLEESLLQATTFKRSSEVATEETKRLQKEVERWKGEAEALREKVEDAEMELTRAKRRLVLAEQERDTILRDGQEFQESKHRAEMQEWKRKALQAQQTVTEANERADLYQHEVERLKTAQLKDTTTIESERTSLSHKIKELEQRSASAKSDLVEMEAKYHKAQEDFEAAAKRERELQTASLRHEMEIKMLEEKLRKQDLASKKDHEMFIYQLEESKATAEKLSVAQQTTSKTSELALRGFKMVLQKINSLFGVQIAYSDAIHSEAEFEAWADELKVAVLLITRTHSSLEKKLKETEQRVADEWHALRMKLTTRIHKFDECRQSIREAANYTKSLKEAYSARTAELHSVRAKLEELQSRGRLQSPSGASYLMTPGGDQTPTRTPGVVRHAMQDEKMRQLEAQLEETEMQTREMKSRLKRAESATEAERQGSAARVRELTAEVDRLRLALAQNETGDFAGLQSPKSPGVSALVAGQLNEQVRAELRHKDKLLDRERARSEQFESQYLKVLDDYQRLRRKLDKREAVISKALKRLELINSKQSHLHIAILRQVSDDVVGWMKEAEMDSDTPVPPTPDHAKKAKQIAAWAKLADLPKRSSSANPALSHDRLSPSFAPAPSYRPNEASNGGLVK